MFQTVFPPARSGQSGSDGRCVRSLHAHPGQLQSSAQWAVRTHQSQPTGSLTTANRISASVFFFFLSPGLMFEDVVEMKCEGETFLLMEKWFDFEKQN